MAGAVTPVAVLALVVLVAGWVAYPAALSVLPRRFRAAESPAADPPAVTVVVATREPPEVLVARVANLHASDYPRDRIAVAVAVDRDAAAPLAAYRALLAGTAGVTVVPGDAPGGKAANLNAALREVRTDLVAFADSAQAWDADALAWLVRALEQPGVGGVTGAIATDAERGVFALFWRYESWLRTLASRTGRVVAVTGAIHALRRECWAPLPPGLICDDLLVPLRVARLGRAVVAEPRARARDPRRFARAVQLQRKTRTLTGLLQVCAWEPWVLLPWRNPVWGSFACHKLVRVATPLLVALAAAPLLLAVPLGLLGLAVAVPLAAALLLAPLAGWPSRRVATELFWAARLLVAPLHALANAVRGRWDVWHAHPR